jgi:hypothetical protein
MCCVLCVYVCACLRGFFATFYQQLPLSKMHNSSCQVASYGSIMGT